MFEKNAPDIVLLDIMLPELNGLEVLRRIRKTSHTPVIMLTARRKRLPPTIPFYRRCR